MKIEDIVEKIASYYGLCPDDIFSRDKHGNVSRARNYAYYILHCECNFSVGQISKAFFRTNRNIFRRISELKYLINNFNEYKKEYEQIIMLLNDKPITN